MLLAVEGIAGSGKSTLRDRVLTAAATEGITVGHIGQFSWLSLPATRIIIGLRAGRQAPTTEDAIFATRRDLQLHARHNLAPALAAGPVIADRLTWSTACLLALLHNQPIRESLQQLAEVTYARAGLTLLLTTTPELCRSRLSRRPSTRRYGEDPPTATRLAELYDQAANAWTDVTGLPVMRHPCATDTDLEHLVAACLDRLRAETDTASDR